MKNSASTEGKEQFNAFLTVDIHFAPEQLTPGHFTINLDFRYDFVGVLQWFAERVDRIILLFDANKLDISDEFRRSIESIHGYEGKVIFLGRIL